MIYHVIFQKMFSDWLLEEVDVSQSFDYIKFDVRFTDLPCAVTIVMVFTHLCLVLPDQVTVKPVGKSPYYFFQTVSILAEPVWRNGRL